jgi:hypothetical protein
VPTDDALLEAALNLARFHREHEKYYAEAPLEDAIALQRFSRTLRSLAERWSAVEPRDAPSATSPFAGAEDLNDERAIKSLGVLFMEGEGEPAEILKMKAELRASAEAAERTGAWLEQAMEAAWEVAGRLVSYHHLTDVLGVRHPIVANDWRAAQLARLGARHLRRALDVLERIDFSPAALRADLAGERTAPRYLFVAAELIDRAVDFSAEGSVLTRLARLPRPGRRDSRCLGRRQARCSGRLRLRGHTDGLIPRARASTNDA